jgi:hypothetical protein
MDNTALERIAASDLAPDALALLQRFGDNDDVVFFLGRLVWQGEMAQCAPPLLEIALDSARGKYARIAAVRGVMSVGSEAQKDRLWDVISTQPTPLDHSVFAEILDWAAPNTRSVSLLLRTLDRVSAPARFEATGLGQALHGFIDRLPVMADGATVHPLAQLTEGLHGFLRQEPFLERGECHVSQAYAWLMAPALHAVDRLVSARCVEATSPAAIEIMRNEPALRYWNRDDIDDYKSSLAENVRRWSDLNDLLYWSSIEAARTREKKPIVDDWQVGYLGHFWAFGPEDFERCLSWVRTKAGDDRLVALSRCVQLFAEANRPAAWRDALAAAAKSDPVLEASLDARLDPEPSPAMLESEARHLAWKAEREAEARKEGEQHADWVRALQADPERVRRPPGLKPGEMSRDQAHLMNNLNSDGATRTRFGADWQGLVPEFGEPVARAYRDAAVAMWRPYRPELRSEGADTSRTPFALMFAMAGLAIEFDEVEGFAQTLTPAEVRHALHYITWELNGFPDWFETLYRAHPVLGLEAIRTELIWNLDESSEGHTLHYILHDIVYHVPWLHADVAPILMEWLQTNDPANAEDLSHIITILTSGGVAPQALAELAARRAENAPASPRRPRWFALWVDADPARAIPALERILDELSQSEASNFAQEFIVALIGGRRGSGSRVGGYRNVGDLKRLYILMHRHVRVTEDIERANKGVYSPTMRDDAQDARNWLFNQLAEEPGPEAYAAVKSLERDHPEPGYRRWMATRAAERATKDADEPLWTVDQVRDFEASLSGLGVARA